MASFINLEDTPMFRKQLHSLEKTADELKERCQKLHKGCKWFIASIGTASDGDIAFAESLEAFGAGCDDPISVAIGGPVMSKFTNVFRELGTYKELLRSQVEHMLGNRLLEFISIDLQDAKDSRRRFDRAQAVHDQAREKFMSLKKGARPDVVADLEEEFHNSKSASEKCRFNLVSALANIEAKKKYEFLESVSAIMDAHMRYYKHGYELLSQMESFIHQVLTYAQQSKEITSAEHDNLERRIQEFRTQEELDSLRALSINQEESKNGDGIHIVGKSSYKSIEALMQSSARGEVQTIKQGYLLKQSSNLRGDWKRRFFVLDSHGTLYYYRNKWNKQLRGSQQQQSSSISDRGAGMFGRFKFSHHRALSPYEENICCRTVDLRTSTIKIDAEQADLRFCFRIISPLKTITLQAENVTDRMEWVDNITAVIASLLNSSYLKQAGPESENSDSYRTPQVYASNSLLTDHVSDVNSDMDAVRRDVSRILRNISGNDVCAECNTPEPDWASLNLGILLCIECSGVHRNLGVHISKVRSLTLDVKVWEPTVMDLFGKLGNSYCNSVWEELLPLTSEGTNEANELPVFVTKPSSQDSISVKEKYIQSKYVDKILVAKDTTQSAYSIATEIWEGVKYSNVQAVYRLLVGSDANPNTTYDVVNCNDLYHIDDEQNVSGYDNFDRKLYDPASCQKIKNPGEPADCLKGCSLLHLACHAGSPVMMELLLQFGADINMRDFHGRTPLHHCVSKRNDVLAKYLVKRGANPYVKDGGGQTALERAMELGPVTDEELLILLVGSE